MTPAEKKWCERQTRCIEFQFKEDQRSTLKAFLNRLVDEERQFTVSKIGRIWCVAYPETAAQPRAA